MRCVTTLLTVSFASYNVLGRVRALWKFKIHLNSAEILIDSKKYIYATISNIQIYGVQQPNLEMEPKYLTKADFQPIPSRYLENEEKR